MGIISATFAVRTVMLGYNIASRCCANVLSPPREVVHRVPSPKADRQPRSHKPRRADPNLTSNPQPCHVGAQQKTHCIREQSGS